MKTVFAIATVIFIALMLFSINSYVKSTSQTVPVPVDCRVSDWSVPQCSATCGTGTRTKTRTIVQQPQYGGQPCPSLTEPENCNTQPCPISPPISVPVDCRVSDWSVPQCSATCGTGTRTKTRTILQYPQYGGQPCPSLTEPENCNTQPCPISPPISVPVDCRVSDWSVPQCSATCGTGTRTKTRTILQYPQYGGQPCPSLTEPENCNTQPCPVDCRVSDWSVSQCSATCGTGTRTKTRTILQYPQYGGQPCPSLTGEENCMTKECLPRRNPIIDCGYRDRPRGWYDIQNQGVKNDYCRFVGNPGNTWFSCYLAGTNPINHTTPSSQNINPNQPNEPLIAGTYGC